MFDLNLSHTPIVIDDLPLYRVRITLDHPGARVDDFGRRLFSARRFAADMISRSHGSLTAVVESYDRHTGATIRIVG